MSKLKITFMEFEDLNKKEFEDGLRNQNELVDQHRIYSNICNKTEGLKNWLTESKGRAEDTEKNEREFETCSIQYELLILPLQNELFDEDKASIWDDLSGTKFDWNQEQNLQAFKDTDFEEDTKNVGGQIKDTEIDILAKIVQRSSFEKEECNDAPFDLINWPTFMKHNQQNLIETKNKICKLLKIQTLKKIPKMLEVK